MQFAELNLKCYRSLPEIDGLSKETVLTSWLAKFDCIMKGTGKLILKLHPSNMKRVTNFNVDSIKFHGTVENNGGAQSQEK